MKFDREKDNKEYTRALSETSTRETNILVQNDPPPFCFKGDTCINVNKNDYKIHVFHTAPILHISFPQYSTDVDAAPRFPKGPVDELQVGL